VTVITLPPNSHELCTPPTAKLKLRADMPSACPWTAEIREVMKTIQFGVEMNGEMKTLDPNWAIKELDHPESEAETIGPQPEAEPIPLKGRRQSSLRRGRGKQRPEP